MKRLKKLRKNGIIIIVSYGKLFGGMKSWSILYWCEYACVETCAIHFLVESVRCVCRRRPASSPTPTSPLKLARVSRVSTVYWTRQKSTIRLTPSVKVVITWRGSTIIQHYSSILFVHGSGSRELPFNNS